MGPKQYIHVLQMYCECHHLENSTHLVLVERAVRHQNFRGQSHPKLGQKRHRAFRLLLQ